MTPTEEEVEVGYQPRYQERYQPEGRVHSTD